MAEIIDTEGRRLEALPVRQDKPMQAVSATPSDLLKLAVEQGAGLDTLKEFMALKREWEADEARKAFNTAFAAFKSKAVRIIKRTLVKDGPLKGRKHANLFDVIDATTEPLAAEGLSLSWKLTKDEPQWMEVTCTLRHSAGHSESVSMGAAPDAGPGRNAIQARGSAKTYLERYTATGILGLAATEQDDDGAGGTTEAVMMTQDHQLTAQALCEELGPTILGNVLKSYKAKDLADIPDAEYETIVTKLQNMKKKRESK